MDGRYGDDYDFLEGAEFIATFFPPEGAFAGVAKDDVYQLLKKLQPVFYNAEVGYARRWANAELYTGKRVTKYEESLGIEPTGKPRRKPWEKKGPATEDDKARWAYWEISLDGQDVSDEFRDMDRRSPQAKSEFANLFFEKGKATPPLRRELSNDPSWRPMSRDPIRAIKPHLKKFADSHAFPGGRDMRFYDEDIGPVLAMPHIKRLCLLVSQFFWPLYCEMHWMKD